MKIFDLDGTLTLSYGDKPEKGNAFKTYAFWPLISYFFAKNPSALQAEANAWDSSDKGTGKAFVKSSQDMLQRGILSFKEGVDQAAVINRAKEITHRFIEHGIIRLDAIEYLNRCLTTGETCIISTGSYKDGAIGFIEALIEAGLLDGEAASNHLIISGAEIDWASKRVQHANIAENKVKILPKLCAEKGLDFNPEGIVEIFVDDPLGNDKGLCELKPDAVYVIETNKNKDMVFDDRYHRTTWPEHLSLSRHHSPRK